MSQLSTSHLFSLWLYTSTELMATSIPQLTNIAIVVSRVDNRIV